jgi:hypothetical protein
MFPWSRRSSLGGCVRVHVRYRSAVTPEKPTITNMIISNYISSRSTKEERELQYTDGGFQYHEAYESSRWHPRVIP